MKYEKYRLKELRKKQGISYGKISSAHGRDKDDDGAFLAMGAVLFVCTFAAGAVILGAVYLFKSMIFGW